MDRKKVGLLVWDFTDIQEIKNEWMDQCYRYCDSLIVAVPEDDVYRRAFASEPKLAFDVKRQHLLGQAGIKEVIPIPFRCIESDLFQNLHETHPFQIFFYGTDYGQEFLYEQKELKKRNVTVIPLIPRGATSASVSCSFRYMLNNLMPDIKIILFGAGKYFDIYMKQYGVDFRPEYAVDNNQKLWGTKKSGIWIESPDRLKKENVAHTIVILCCKEGLLQKS